MKILLVGEYSRLHNSLKEGLVTLGHDVLLVGTADGFKNFNVDINYEATFFTRPSINWLVKAILKLTTINLIKLEYAYRFNKILKSLKGFDVVQLINQNSIKTHPFIEKRLLNKLISQNKKTFLLACGTDYVSVQYALDKKFKYSILTPYFNNADLKKYYNHILKKTSSANQKLFAFLQNNTNGIISSDLDYHLPYNNKKGYLGMIPNPIIINNNDLTPTKNESKIVIFHGINTSNYIKKGNDIFDKALDTISKKYPDTVDVVRTENVPYTDYITSYNSCHILMDQIYAYDQGYNALEAMSKGKVVFTGAEKEWLDYYNLEEDTVAIHALPSVDYLVEKLDWLINNPDQIERISKHAIAFIKTHHHYKKIAKQYLDTWNKA
ncbi:glycosyltransferase [Olleya sp. YS]|uniref:glycosyltransferase n=1 Tax=Olleya sp. YS TaxID=3028318 RepID=UPI0024343B8E|nr:glycosyltransferase [Olleya sp. YS]WGD35141.1 glycosyltransferase [Olleya sp. YS]